MASLIGSFFELILLVLTIASLSIVLINKVLLKSYPHRKSGVVADYAKSLFPVFLIVLIVRSFLFEPFKIPSASMLPTLKIGDFIFVNKFAYGVRWPIWSGHKIFATGEPKRGDVIVFKYPVNTNVNYIKRVIGVGGDKISYIDKQLYINGVKTQKKFISQVADSDLPGISNIRKYQTKIAHNHNNKSDNKSDNKTTDLSYNTYNFSFRDSVSFKDLVIPKGYYFVMGDDRDDSEDSRFWGLVADKYLVGKAQIVWWSWSGNNSWKPRWSRIGLNIYK